MSHEITSPGLVTRLVRFVYCLVVRRGTAATGVHPRMVDEFGSLVGWNSAETRQRRRRETCTGTALSTTNLTWDWTRAHEVWSQLRRNLILVVAKQGDRTVIDTVMKTGVSSAHSYDSWGSCGCGCCLCIYLLCLWLFNVSVTHVFPTRCPPACIIRPAATFVNYVYNIKITKQFRP